MFLVELSYTWVKFAALQEALSPAKEDITQSHTESSHTQSFNLIFMLIAEKENFVHVTRYKIPVLKGT